MTADKPIDVDVNAELQRRLSRIYSDMRDPKHYLKIFPARLKISPKAGCVLDLKSRRIYAITGASPRAAFWLRSAIP